MIVKDEEEVLERCLDSVKDVVDEIIIVDTGSTDKTKEIAYKFTDKVYDFEWINDFAAARNYSFSKATMEYCMWLDADDYIREEEREKILKLKEQYNDGDVDSFMIKYAVSFNEAGKSIFSYYRERIIRNFKKPLWQGKVHEVIPYFENRKYEDIEIEHRKISQKDPKRNLKIYEMMIKNGEKMNQREKFYYGRELFYNDEIEKAIFALEDFLNGRTGWIENKLEACRQLAACYEKLKMQEKRINILFYALKLMPPRAELCCEIGRYFMEKEEWDQAIFWYENALRSKKDLKSGAFVFEPFYDYIPAIQLCVCYDKIGETQKAYEYNELAGKYYSKSKPVESNRKYFKNKLNL